LDHRQVRTPRGTSMCADGQEVYDFPCEVQMRQSCHVLFPLS
jgi:hypothetical protein